MSEIQNNKTSDETTLSPEELLGPPRVDITGFGIMLVLSLVVGFFAGVGVLIFAFFTSGKFSLQSGASPILLAMVTFFCLTFANYLYVWGMGVTFPNIYSRTRTTFVQVSIFSIILYVIMTILYIMTTMMYSSSSSILGAFTLHVMVNAFGLVLLTGLLASYRYILLIFYADILAFVVSGLFVLWIYINFSGSETAIFSLMGLIAMSFFLFTLIPLGVMALYYQLYRMSGSDPLGDVFSSIEREEKYLEKEAEKTLLAKK